MIRSTHGNTVFRPYGGNQVHKDHPANVAREDFKDHPAFPELLARTAWRDLRVSAACRDVQVPVEQLGGEGCKESRGCVDHQEYRVEAVDLAAKEQRGDLAAKARRGTEVFKASLDLPDTLDPPGLRDQTECLEGEEERGNRAWSRCQISGRLASTAF